MELEKAFIQLDASLLRYLNYDVEKLSFYAKRQLEIGFGNGEFLLNMAEHFKNEVFFGVEYQKKYFFKALKWAQIKGLKNIKLFCSEAESTLNFLFPDNFFDCVHINFPDPWHKRRHSERRLMDEIFVKELKRVLKKGGKVYFTTDVKQYFMNVVSFFQKSGFMQLDWERLANPNRPYKTKYEKAFIEKGQEIFYLLAKKS